MVLRLVVLIVAATALTLNASGATRAGRIVFEGKATEIASADVTEKGLWVTTDDLGRATGFHIKPQGICRDELCFPIPAKRKTEFIVKRGTATWFNLTEFAALIKQAVAQDEKNGIWYFGQRSQAHETYLESLEAPNFTLPDQNGKQHSLSEYRGKKVLLVTWASW